MVKLGVPKQAASGNRNNFLTFELLAWMYIKQLASTLQKSIKINLPKNIKSYPKKRFFNALSCFPAQMQPIALYNMNEFK